MTIAEAEEKYTNDFILLDDAGSQYEYLLFLGMKYQGNESLRISSNRIGGCKTAIWLQAWCGEDGVHFSGDSDSLLVKGVLNILDDLYSGKSPEQIRLHPPIFLEYISDEVIYPEIKNNGILKCYQRLATLNI